MKLTHLQLDQLKPASVNVRKRGGKDTGDLLPSIRSLGLLQPLLVRPNCEGFEIIAGQRRYHALSKLADEGTADPVPCIIMEDGDDAKAIEASLAENIARLPMDEIDQYKAFAALTKQGRSVEDIAAQFGVSSRLVTQRLAIANIIDPILNAYRRKEIDAQTLRILTMSTKRQQKHWWALFKDDDSHAPQGHALRSWLFGGADIPVDNALFDETEYKGAIVSDLFGETRYFDDATNFWTLQSAAIARLKADYLADGWQDVTVLDIGEHWPKWKHRKAAKQDGGRVYIQISHDGEVTAHEGWLTDKEAAKLEKAKAALMNGQTPSSPARPELTKLMQNYLDLHRHAVVRAELIGHRALALRVAVAQIIAGSRHWSVQADPQKANTKAIGASLETNSATKTLADERAFIARLLDLSIEDAETIVPRTHDWGRSHDIHVIFAKLMKLNDDEVMDVLTFVVAETLACGDGLVEILGSVLSVDLSKHWTPDDTFFDLLRDKETINAMLKEVGGKAVADAHVASTAKVQKSIIRQHLDGTRKPHREGWTPRYAEFPMRAYTKRSGVDAIERGKTAKKALKAA